MNIFLLKVHEWLFLLAGLGILIALPWIEGTGFWIWLVAKACYFVGIPFFLADMRKNKATS